MQLTRFWNHHQHHVGVVVHEEIFCRQRFFHSQATPVPLQVVVLFDVNSHVLLGQFTLHVHMKLVRDTGPLGGVTYNMDSSVSL